MKGKERKRDGKIWRNRKKDIRLIKWKKSKKNEKEGRKD